MSLFLELFFPFLLFRYSKSKEDIKEIGRLFPGEYGKWEKLLQITSILIHIT